jgi:hypothetical protein
MGGPCLSARDIVLAPTLLNRFPSNSISETLKPDLPKDVNGIFNVSHEPFHRYC